MLLTDAQEWRDAAAKADIKIDVHPATACADAYGIGDAGAVLVRPDGFVGWRAESTENATAAVFAEMLGTLIAQPSRVGDSAG